MPDKNGYPTEGDLKTLVKLANANPLNTSISNVKENLLDFLETIWWSSKSLMMITERTLKISTGGWSGNEDIIEKLQGTLFWMMCWNVSRRGGYYEFDLSVYPRD